MLDWAIRKKEKLYTYVLYTILFLSSVFPYADKDWGWHYKYGEYLLTQGKLLLTDQFSWTLPGYYWVNHSWLYDPFLYILSNGMGLVGLSLVAALFNTATFIIVLSSFQLSYWKKAILAGFFLLLSEPSIAYGLRSQVVSLFLFSILMTLLIRGKENFKILFWIPLLFLLWVNVHGDFTVGLGITGLFLGCYFLIDIYTHKKISQKLFWIYTAISGACLTMIFINPFGGQVFIESFRHMSSPYLQFVFEWNPLFDQCGYCHPYTFIVYCGFCIASFIFLLKKRKFLVFPYLIFFLIFFFPTLNTRRILPIFCVVTLPILAIMLQKLRWNIDTYKVTPYIFFLLIVLGFEINLYNRFVALHIYTYTEDDFCTYSSNCSPGVVAYLISHPPRGKGFTFYDWGGYLIGRGLKAKVFIDGRMHLWDKNGYSPFGDYIGMYYDEKYDLFNKYDFDWVLIPRNGKLAEVLSSSKKLGTWKMVFEDKKAIYFIKVK